MKDPDRLFSEGGPLAQALQDLRQQAPDAERLTKMARALSDYGVDVKLDLPPSGPEAAAAKAGWSVAAKTSAAVGGAVAIGLVLVLLGRGAGDSHGIAPTHGTPSAPASPSPRAADGSGAKPQAHPTAAPARPGGADTAVVTPSAAERAVGPEGQHAASEKLPSAQAPSLTPPSSDAANDAPRSTSSGTARGTTNPTLRSDPTQESEEVAPELEPEISLLKRAREALDKNPGTALALAEQHRRDYTKAQLGQEREVIAITALMRMGMPTSAQKRAEQFKRTYPRSAYLGQIERIVDR